MVNKAFGQFTAAHQVRGLGRTRREVADAKMQDTLRRIALIAEDWPKREKSTPELLAEAGVKPGKPMAPATARAHLGSRPAVQAAYEREQAREAGRRAGAIPGRKPKA